VDVETMFGDEGLVDKNTGGSGINERVWEVSVVSRVIGRYKKILQALRALIVSYSGSFFFYLGW